MADQDSEETPIAFHDVAAYFSEEEWKLLHQWQKELYTNVMEEIHQALISLGYQIINPEVLLRINKGAEAYTQDFQDPERREHINDQTSTDYLTVHPDILFRIKQGEELCHRHGCEETEIGNSLSKGIAAPSVYSLSTEEEEEMCTIDPKDSERTYNNNGLSSDTNTNLDLIIGIQREQNLFLTDHQSMEGRETIAYIPTEIPCLNPGISLRMDQESSASLLDHYRSEIEKNVMCASSVTPFRIKEEGDAHCMDYKDLERTESISPTGNGTMNTERKSREAVKCIKTISSAVKVEMPQSSEKGTTSRGQLVSESNQELGGEKSTLYEGGFTNSADSMLYRASPQLEGSGIGNDYVSDLKDTKLVTCQQNTQQRFRPYQCNTCGIFFSRKVHLITHQIAHTGETGDTPYQCTECETSFSQKLHLIAHQRTHTGIKPYHCTGCEKSFSEKIHLIAHERKHMGLKPYQCTECEQSFKRKTNCITHQRIHTGERPYTCSECEKSYSSKPHLNRHKKTHEGGRPFQCTKCERSYIEKGSLTKHYKTHSFSMKNFETNSQVEHTENILYQCTQCEKSYDTTHQLSTHMRTHMEERPYRCTECGQRFKEKGTLSRHKRTHTGERPYQCPECGKSFIRKQHVISHQRTHLVREESLETIACMGMPNGLETVSWTIEGNNELVSVPRNEQIIIS